MATPSFVAVHPSDVHLDKVRTRKARVREIYRTIKDGNKNSRIAERFCPQRFTPGGSQRRETAMGSLSTGQGRRSNSTSIYSFGGSHLLYSKLKCRHTIRVRWVDAGDIALADEEQPCSQIHQDWSVNG
jgi:hypothetical protein